MELSEGSGLVCHFLRCSETLVNRVRFSSFYYVVPPDTPRVVSQRSRGESFGLKISCPIKLRVPAIPEIAGNQNPSDSLASESAPDRRL